MRTLVLVAVTAAPLIALLVPASASAQDALWMRQRYAVVVGVGEYRDPHVGDSRYGAADARAFHDFLRSPAAGLGGFDEANVRLLVDEQATGRNIRSALTTFLRTSTPEDIIVVFLVGQGAPDPLRPTELYLLPHDVDMADIPGTAIPMAMVEEALRDVYAWQTMVFVDATPRVLPAEGGADPSPEDVPSRLQRMKKPAGGFVIFSGSQPGQRSHEGEEFGGGHGIFTFYLLEGLKGAADGDGDRVVTLIEVMEYTRDRVRRATRNAQIPDIYNGTYDMFWPLAAVMDGR